MSTQPVPDYDLEEIRVVTATAQVKAMFYPLRSAVLDLVLERAATVGELAEAVDRPPSTVAYHVGVLVDAGLLRVVRTRKVRAIEERFYGRTARIFYVGAIGSEQLAHIPNLLTAAAADSSAAHKADDLRAVLRHAHISPDQAAEFWKRVFELVGDYSRLPSQGDHAYALVLGLYPTVHPRLPEPDLDSGG